MKNKFDFYGIKSPQRKILLRSFIKENGIPEGEDLKELVLLLWYDPHREMQYSAIELLDRKMKKMTPDDIPFFEKLILTKSWWDTVDWLAPNACGKILLKNPLFILPLTNRWNLSDNKWLVRSSILFQLKYRNETDFELLKKYILRHKKSTAFFIQKAAGWSLRQYAKYNPTIVKSFILENETDLPRLTVREGMKHLK